ncbi:MAG: CDP-2,3-bis-(O-geranylgeranyl)-sn-glycerol synthase [Hadesarchaea archaeon]|nr:CDP-2,3-bis-(O-geranylgeranyl)-sn-glycerol synthase [Hadesarchaea archaeon]
MNEIIQFIGESIWFILPAYFANSVPILAKGSTPLDMKRKLSDGERIFGSGKTFRGFILGLLAGLGIGVLQNRLMIGLLLALGALLGDLTGSFVKRRIGLTQGEFAPFLDQLDFVVGGILIVSLINPLTWRTILVILIITIPIHLLTNFLGYKLGLKSRPY